METSMLIARIIGPCYIIIALGMMFNRKFYQKVMDDFCKNTALLLYGGLLALVIGILIVLSHNVWAANWTVIITIFGWLGIIKGVWMLVFPETVSGFMRSYQENPSLLVVHSVIALVLGIVLTIPGYFAG